MFTLPHFLSTFESFGLVEVFFQGCSTYQRDLFLWWRMFTHAHPTSTFVFHWACQVLFSRSTVFLSFWFWLRIIEISSLPACSEARNAYCIGHKVSSVLACSVSRTMVNTGFYDIILGRRQDLFGTKTRFVLVVNVQCSPGLSRSFFLDVQQISLICFGDGECLLCICWASVGAKPTSGAEPWKNSGQQGFGTVGKPWFSSLTY